MSYNHHTEADFAASDPAAAAPFQAAQGEVEFETDATQVNTTAG